MIIDLPRSDDFKSIANEWLVQSFQIIYDYGDELEYLSDWKDEDWHFHKGKLSTALVLIHQAIEAQMKAEICDASPYFLIEMKQQEWPTLPDSKDKSFNELFTIGSEALIRVYLAVCRHKKDQKKLVELFEEVRIKRNKIIHGLYKEILDPKYLLELQFRTAQELFPNDFWNMLKVEEKKHPLYSELEDEDLISELYYKLKFIYKYFSSGRKFRMFLNVEGRYYYCPECTDKAQDWDQGTVYLRPNSPQATAATCVICDYKYEVVRRPCPNASCKGNVIWIDPNDADEIYCLTCNEGIDPSDL